MRKEIKLPPGWKQKRLDEILNPEQMKAVRKILKSTKDMEKVNKLKEYFLTIEKDLEAKGFYHGFLAYAVYAMDEGII